MAETFPNESVAGNAPNGTTDYPGAAAHTGMARSGFRGQMEMSCQFCRQAALLNHDPVQQAYCVRNRTYSPVVGRVLRQEPKSRHTAGAAPWVIQRDPIGYQGGINLYGYVGSSPGGRSDSAGLKADVSFEGGPDGGSFSVREGFDLKIFGLELAGLSLDGEGSYYLVCVRSYQKDPHLGWPAVKPSIKLHFFPPSAEAEVAIKEGPLSQANSLGVSFPAWDLMSVNGSSRIVYNHYLAHSSYGSMKIHADASLEFIQTYSGLLAAAAYAVGSVAPEVDLGAAFAVFDAQALEVARVLIALLLKRVVT